MGTPNVRVYDLALLGWTSICDMQAANDEHMRHLASATLLPVALTIIWRDCECNPSRRLSRTPWLIEPLQLPTQEWRGRPEGLQVVSTSCGKEYQRTLNMRRLVR